MRKTPGIACLCGLLAILPASDGAAALVPISQARFVNAFAALSFENTNPAQGDSAAAPNFEPFVEQVSADVTLGLIGVPPASSAAQASQDSSIGANQISAQGGASIDRTLPPGVYGSANASSSFEMFFRVSVTSTYDLTGFIDSQAILTGGAPLPSITNRVRLEENGGSVLFESLTSDEAFATSGVLTAGTIYHLFVLSSVQTAGLATASWTTSGDATFDFGMTLSEVPEPATSVLLGAGLAAIARRRRMQRS